MDKQRLLALLQKSEGPKLDFKLQLSFKADSEKKELAKDVTAIANSKGGRGYIIFGVQDKTKILVGIEDRKYSEEQIQQIISQRCDPPVSIKFDTISIDNKVIGVLTIYKSTQKPHQIRQTGSFYIRRGSTTDIARREEVASMLQETGIIQYEQSLLHGVDLSELDNNIIEKYFDRAGLNSNEDNYYTLLQSAGIIGKDEDSSRFHPTIGGLLVFGYNPQAILPHCGIRLINNKEYREVRYFTGPIIKMLDNVEEYFNSLFDKTSYPVSTLLEAVTNAAVHRDYFATSREIVIAIEKDKIEVSNPGAVCGDDDALNSLEEYNPYRRNQWLYQRLLILDNKNRFLKSGMGIKRIEQAFRPLGGAKFINYEKRNLFKVILPSMK